MTVVLGIETSCDETAASIVVDGREVRSSVVSSQIELHVPYGGVVPEIAGRAHVQRLNPVVREAPARRLRVAHAKLLRRSGPGDKRRVQGRDDEGRSKCDLSAKHSAA